MNGSKRQLQGGYSFLPVHGSWGTWALEIKTSAFHAAQLNGLLDFCRRYPRYRPLVITAPGDEPLATRLGLTAMNWSEFLLTGLRS